MRRREKADRIGEILDDLYPDPPIPLDHTDPYTLLVAVALSAQTTDKKVNAVTPFLAELRNRSGVEGEFSKVARVLVDEEVAAEVHDHGCMFGKNGLCRDEIHTAGHSKMSDKRQGRRTATLFDFEDKVLPASFESDEGCVAQCALKLCG